MSARVRAFLIPFALILLASTAWVFATPLAGSPDEPAHIVRAAGVAHGQLLPLSTDAEGRGVFDVPGGLAGVQQWDNCFAHKGAQDASCQIIGGTDDASVQVGSSAGLYNPLYYALVGWPSLLTNDPHIMVYAMRLLTAAGSSAFAALAMVFLSRITGTRRTSLVVAATVTPMVLFLAGSVNPNAWEITGGMAMLAAILSLGFAPDAGDRRRSALATIAVSGFIVANLRGISVLWVAVMGVIGLLAIWGPRLSALSRRAAMWVTLGIVAAGVAIAGVWTLSAGGGSLEGDYANKGWTAARVVEYMVRRTVFEPGYVGLFGWLDTPAPIVAIVLIGGLAVAIVVAAFWLGGARLLLATIVAMVAWLVIPAMVQLAYVRMTGIIWQARYTMVLYAAVILLAAVAAHVGSGGARIMRARRLTVVIGVAVVFAHTYTFAAMQQRYARGTDGSLWLLIADPKWSPPGGALLWLALTFVSISGFVVYAARANASRSGASLTENALV